MRETRAHADRAEPFQDLRLEKRMPRSSEVVRGSAAVILGLVCVCGVGAAQDLESRVQTELGHLLETYRHLHANPELSLHEEKTAAYVAGRLRELGFEVTEHVGAYPDPHVTPYGLVAVMKNGDGPTVMVRTDLDALPVEEATGLPYASTVRTRNDAGVEVGVMHACGHDVHMTSFLGTATLLSRMKDRWSGTLVMIGQPAEELGMGARAMLADGLYERFPRPDFAIALHAEATLPAGKVGYRSEYALANVDSVDITVYGEGGHGAYPQTTRDPIVIAARIVVALQTIVSREISPLDPAVITVGSFHGGSKHNVIPDEVHLQLTVRSYEAEVREHLLEGIRRVAENVARSADVPEGKLPLVEIAEEEYTPATYNDPELTNRVVQVFQKTLGPENVVEVAPVMGGEDFGRYSLANHEIPTVLFWLGTVPPDRARAARAEGTHLPSLHSSQFAPAPERTIATGVLATTSAVLDLMRP
jgi:amidohydrolase